MIADVFLDLDGTLTDPKPGITACIQHALTRLDRPVPHADELEWCIGPPLHDSFAQLLGGEADVDRAVALYRERFGDVGLFENAVYDGVVDMLDALQAGGARLHLATSKPLVYAEQITAHFGLDAWLDCQFGSELGGRNADKRNLLADALARTGASAANAVMIGDRKHDMIGAAHNGIAAWGVLYGYGSEDELTAAGAQRLFHGPQDVRL